MARRKGSTNKNPPAAPDTTQLTTEQRLEFLANLIVERILDDKTKGQPLLKKIGGSSAEQRA